MVGAATAAMIVMLPASVSASDDEVRKTGSCSGTAGWEMRAKWDDDERIELRGRVEDTRSGQTWTWKIKHNGSVSAQGRAVTGSSGFEVRRALVDLAGRGPLRVPGRAGQDRRGVPRPDRLVTAAGGGTP